jgi:hypothetical protein
MDDARFTVEECFCIHQMEGGRLPRGTSADAVKCRYVPGAEDADGDQITFASTDDDRCKLHASIIPFV